MTSHRAIWRREDVESMLVPGAGRASRELVGGVDYEGEFVEEALDRRREEPRRRWD